MQRQGQHAERAARRFRNNEACVAETFPDSQIGVGLLLLPDFAVQGELLNNAFDELAPVCRELPQPTN